MVHTQHARDRMTLLRSMHKPSVQLTAYLPHQQIDVVLKHVMELFQGFMIAFSCLLLLLFQQVYQDLVLQPFDKDSFVSRPWCPCTSLHPMWTVNTCVSGKGFSVIGAS